MEDREALDFLGSPSKSPALPKTVRADYEETRSGCGGVEWVRNASGNQTNSLKKCGGSGPGLLFQSGGDDGHCLGARDCREPQV